MAQTSGARMSAEEFQALFDRCSNWGRWGAEDERGALNLITPEHRVRAAGLVRDGVPRMELASLRLPLLKVGGCGRERLSRVRLSLASDHPGEPLWHALASTRLRPGDLSEQSGPSAKWGILMSGPRGSA